ncbi:MAG: hypothetical protein A2W17_10120 [Planctomycetes bacterium RBG_16_41_13]|nr:MAG: hypothetical protein A2W17_10120 [Planctomycetes bacterium RBG_16_41_13]
MNIEPQNKEFRISNYETANTRKWTLIFLTGDQRRETEGIVSHKKAQNAQKNTENSPSFFVSSVPFCG